MPRGVASRARDQASHALADTDDFLTQCFGWGKTIGSIRQVMVRGLDKVDQLLTLTMAACNLTRMRRLAQLCPRGAQ